MFIELTKLFIPQAVSRVRQLGNIHYAALVVFFFNQLIA